MTADTMDLAERAADRAEIYRELLSDFGKTVTAYRRYEWRRKMTDSQDRCAEIMAQMQAHRG